MSFRIVVSLSTEYHGAFGTRVLSPRDVNLRYSQQNTRQNYPVDNAAVYRYVAIKLYDKVAKDIDKLRKSEVRLFSEVDRFF